MIKKPTTEQKSIIECNGNIVVIAKPGSGKTFTVVEKIAVILEQLKGHQGIIAISYTNKASDELKSRCRQKGIDTKRSFFGTIDKFYISQIIIPFAGHLTNTIADYNVIRLTNDDPIYGSLCGIDSVSTIKQEMLIQRALREGKVFLELSGQIALYLLENVPGALTYLKARYTHIFIDEYQDCGSIQNEVFMKLVKNNICGIAVGDKDQAIYAFSGRFPTYLLSLQKTPGFSCFELNKNHRCHPSIIEYSRCLMGDAGDVPEEKRVFKVNVNGNEAEISKQIDCHLEAVKKKYGVKENNKIAILCRSNGSLARVNESLITSHKLFEETPLDRLNSEWGRLFRDLLVAYFSSDVFAVDVAQELFYEELEPRKYRSALHILDNLFNTPVKKLVDGVQYFEKVAELVYPERRNNDAINVLRKVVSDAGLYSNYIPAAPNEISLLTLHKSKGLEYNIVFHLDLYEWLLPYSIYDNDKYIQDLNLHYVGITRAIDACFFLIGTFRYVASYNDYKRVRESSFLSIDGLSRRRKDLYW